MHRQFLNLITENDASFCSGNHYLSYALMIRMSIASIVSAQQLDENDF